MIQMSNITLELTKEQLLAITNMVQYSMQYISTDDEPLMI